MPKKVYEINPFHGGINTKDDPRDILDHQLVDVLGASVDSKGVLKIIGNVEDLDITSSDTSDDNESGYGFFRFSADTDASGNSGTDAYNTDYLIYWNEEDEKCYWYNSDDDTWTEALNLITPWSAVATDGKRKPIFSFANGALRVADSNFNNTTNETYWKGILDKTIFKGASNQRIDSGWYTQLASVAKPSAAQIKSAPIVDDDHTQLEDITWSIFSARDSTTDVWRGMDDEDDWTLDDSSGEVLDWIDRRYGGGPYGLQWYQEIGWQSNDWDGSNDSAQTHGYKIHIDEATGSANLRWSGFTIDPEKSLYLSLQLESQDQFDAWGAGWAKNASTTVQYANLTFELWFEEDNSKTIKWNISSADLLKNGIDWFTIELPYSDAFSNTLGTDYDIETIRITLDSNVVRSESHDYSNIINWNAINMADLRQGEPDLLGKDLLGIREVAYSFAYDDKRTESTLRSLGKVDFGSSIYDFGHSIQFGAESFTNKRIRGGTLYVYDNDIPYMLAEADLVYGLRGSWESDWPGDDTSTDQWTQSDAGSSALQENGCSSNIISSNTVPLIETFQARNGFSHKEDTTDARYKSLVITNNRAYAGNVFIDGKQINNLTDGLIDPEQWKTFVNDAGTSGQIFYLPLQSKIQIIGGSKTLGMPTENYEFSIITGGWSRGKYRYITSIGADASNPILDIDNEVKIFVPDSGKVYKWSDVATSNHFSSPSYEIITGDKVFDSSAIRKKIYKVHITHRNVGGSAVVTVYGRADRGSWVSLGTLSNYSNFTVQEFDVSGMSNAKSFQLKITATTAAETPLSKDFEINDINIIYRSKNVR